MKKIEDVTHSEYISALDLFPLNFKFSQITDYANKIAGHLSIPLLDAKAVLFVGIAVKKGCTVMEYEQAKQRRMKEVVAARLKEPNKEQSIND